MMRHLATAATLLHTLPGASAVLCWRDGSERVVGRHPSHDVSVCAWRDAVIQSALTATALPHELLTGLPGLPSVEVVAGSRCRDMGAGVFRHDGVDVFATTLCGPAIRDVAERCPASGHARIGSWRDELTGTTAVAVAHVGSVPPHAGLAHALARACSIAEATRVA